MMCPRSAPSLSQALLLSMGACNTLCAHYYVQYTQKHLKSLTFMHPVVQVLCSWKAFVTALNSKLFQFWLKFW